MFNKTQQNVYECIGFLYDLIDEDFIYELQLKVEEIIMKKKEVRCSSSL